ncbi:MAG: hypothetical protein ISS26_06550 [Candidatus Omnitrophica bacterium]|nr:hypothetical protein [Candidatus Omnitrophota bacterium]
MANKTPKSKKRLIQELHHIPSLHETIVRMALEGRLSKEREEHVRIHLEEWVTDSKYILLNLGIHMTMGLVRFTAFPFPLPIGSTLRPIWVMANRMYCNIIWDMRRKSVHSMTVLLFSIIPFLGYFAYTIPLRKKSEYLAYLYAQHISYMFYDKNLEEKLKKVPRFIKKIANALLVPAEIRPTIK